MTTTAIPGDSPEKRRKISISTKQHIPLLPGLPDHIAQLPISLVSPSLVFSVSLSWRRLLYSPSFPPFLCLYVLSISSQNNALSLSFFDPLASLWHDLSPPPVQPSIRQHPSFLSRYLPMQSVSVSDNLVLVSGTLDNLVNVSNNLAHGSNNLVPASNNLVPAFPRPLVFSIKTGIWEFGPEIGSPRRWCVGGACGNKLFIASGIGSCYMTKTARSVDRLDFCKKGKAGGEWEKMAELERENLSREAIEAVGWRGKLLVADITAKEGFVYDTKRDTWGEMPRGMLEGWRGVAASMDEETVYSVDESKGVLRRYDAERDCWDDIIWASELKGAEQMTAGGGKVCVVRGGCSSGIVVVDVVTSPMRFWTMDTPDGSQPIAAHILPRINRPDL